MIQTRRSSHSRRARQKAKDRHVRMQRRNLHAERLEERTLLAANPFHNGFWPEDHAPLDSPEFTEALARGLTRFAAFLKAQRVQITAIAPQALREGVQAAAGQKIEIRA